jgi:hypothetical protein
MATADHQRIWRHGFAGAVVATALAIVSCSAPHSIPRPTPASDVVLIARFSSQLPPNTLDPAFSQVHPSDLAVVSRALACRAWGLTPVRQGGQQIEVLLRVHASQAAHATNLLRQRHGVTVRSATLDALSATPEPVTPGVPGLPESLPYPTPATR